MCHAGQVEFLKKACETPENIEQLSRVAGVFDQRLSRNVYVLSLTMGAMSFFFGWQQWIPLYITDLGAVAFQVGIFFAVASLAHALSGIPASLRSDRSGRKKFVVAGTLINSFLYAGYALCNSWTLLMLPWFLQQLSHAAYINPMMALLAESAPPEKRGIANGLFQAIAGIITIIAPVFATVLIVYFNGDLRIAIPALFMLTGISVGLMGVVRGLTLRETYDGRLRSPAKSPDAAAKGISASGSLSAPQVPASDEGTSLRSRPVIALYIFIAISSLIVYVITNFVALLGQRISLGDAEIGIWTIVATGVSTIAQVPTGRLADKSSKRTLLLISVLLYAVSMVLFMRTTNFTEFILAQVPLSVGGTLAYNTEFTMIAGYASCKNRSTAFSLQTAINDIVGIPGPLIGGYLFGMAPQYPFMLGLVLTIPAFMVGLILVKEPGKVKKCSP
jgi:AAHS family benzoate transporter-like MFS transporter